MIDIVQSAFQTARTNWGLDFAKAIRPHAASHQASLQRLQDAQTAGDKKGVRSAQHRLLNSHSSKITSLVRAVSATDVIPANSVFEMASNISPYKDCGEPINLRMVPKSCGDGVRPICGFGPRRKAQHKLVADILRAKFPPLPWDYLIRGRGVPKLVEDIIAALGGGQYWVLVADIKDFYRSVQPHQLDTLVGLPKSVVECSLLLPSLSVTSPHTVFDGAVLGGLPQGSGVSGLVASMLCGAWLEQVAQTGHVFLYGDDIMAIAGSELGAKVLEKSLAEYLSTHPQGPFQLKRSEVVHAEAGFDFCGYRYRQDPLDKKIKVRPSGKSYARLKMKVMRIDPDYQQQATEAVPTLLNRWVAAFPAWKPNDLSLAYLEGMVDEAMHDVAVMGYDKATEYHFAKKPKLSTC